MKPTPLKKVHKAYQGDLLTMNKILMPLLPVGQSLISQRTTQKEAIHQLLEEAIRETFRTLPKPKLSFERHFFNQVILLADAIKVSDIII